MNGNPETCRPIRPSVVGGKCFGVDSGQMLRSLRPVRRAAGGYGRESEARAALREMWPAFDQERIWNLILQTRRSGVLRYTRQEAACKQGQ